MGPLDMLLLLVAAACVVLALFQRFVRTVIVLIAAYTGTLISALVYRDVAFRLKAIGQDEAWFEGVVFLLVFFVVFLAIYIASRAAYPDTSLPKLGFVDHLLGGVIGVLIAAILVVVIHNGLSVMVSDYWEPYAAYANLVTLRGGIRLQAFIRQLAQLYALAFYPFFAGIGFPPVLQPL